MAVPAPLRFVTHEVTLYRRLWHTTLVQFVLWPVLYLAAIGGTLGHTIDRRAPASLGGVHYLPWLAPGLLASTAMQLAVTGSMHPVLGGFKWTRHWLAAAATPLRPIDLVSGWMTWQALRLTLASVVFAVVVALVGAVHSAGWLAAVPAAVLCGLAFAGPTTAYAATRQNDSSFANVQRFVILPFFLFSGTFFPVSQLPVGLRPVAYVTPLWHGVTLCRELALGRATAAAILGHGAVLAAFALAGTWSAARTFQRRLAA